MLDERTIVSGERTATFTQAGATWTARSAGAGPRTAETIGVVPTSPWVAQQMRNATPFGVGPRFIIRDRDHKYGRDFDRAAKGTGAKVVKTPLRTPRANAICERFLGSVRRERLDHVRI